MKIVLKFRLKFDGGWILGARWRGDGNDSLREAEFLTAASISMQTMIKILIDNSTIVLADVYHYQ
ncbi:MAG: hypothetical protein C4527_01880 [Candidatus Omnitrophota bacterium]|jgi:hypothetical protein|nr:MAG: hypothetical protein C4527_01880 [Candidatus Omnitrophota bacterium]